MPTTFATQSISQPHQPLKTINAHMRKDITMAETTKHGSGRRGGRLRIAVWAAPQGQEA